MLSPSPWSTIIDRFEPSVAAGTSFVSSIGGTWNSRRHAAKDGKQSDPAVRRRSYRSHTFGPPATNYADCAAARDRCWAFNAFS